MAGDIDYRSVDVPEGKSPEDYTYAERRAEILSLIERRGSPRRLNGQTLGERYGCSRQNIYNDLERLSEWAEESLGDREALEGEALYWRCIEGLLDEGEYRKAAQTLSDYHEWVHERKDLDEMDERLRSLERGREAESDENPFRVK